MEMTLKALRVNFGLKQSEMAEIIGVSPSTWFNYEKGNSYPNQKIIEKIENEFNISYDDIAFYPKLRFKRKTT